MIERRQSGIQTAQCLLVLVGSCGNPSSGAFTIGGETGDRRHNKSLYQSALPKAQCTRRSRVSQHSSLMMQLRWPRSAWQEIWHNIVETTVHTQVGPQTGSGSLCAHTSYGRASARAAKKALGAPGIRVKRLKGCWRERPASSNRWPVQVSLLLCFQRYTINYADERNRWSGEDQPVLA
jgi:hypothetical protein